MGRKKRGNLGEEGPEITRQIIGSPLASAKPKGRERERDDSSDDSSDFPVHYDLDPQVQDLAYTFGLDEQLTEQLNDILVGKRKRTLSQDVARLHEILQDARSPAAVLKLKIKDMLSGRFAGKAKCAPAVKELAKKHKLDKGASTKLEEAMSMREAMGLDIDTDLRLLDEHLAASNKPSALVSQKLETLRKGFKLYHCIYSREVVTGNAAPGVDGVFDKKPRRVRGYSDADLSMRFQAVEGGPRNGELMDEATIMKLMRKEKAKHLSKATERERSQSSRSTPSPLRKKASRSRRRRKSRSPSRRKRKKSDKKAKRRRKQASTSSSS